MLREVKEGVAHFWRHIAHCFRCPTNPIQWWGWLKWRLSVCLAIRFQTLKRLFWFQRKLWGGDWQRAEFDHLISWWTSLPCIMFSNSKVFWLLRRRWLNISEIYLYIDNFSWFNRKIVCIFGALANIALVSAWPCLAKACTHLLLNGSEPFLW